LVPWYIGTVVPAIGIFQLLPHGDFRTVIDAALTEVDFAEANGFESVWIAEHHSNIGMVGAPSVYAAAVAARTTRIRIGYGVAVVPLHHPLRLAEEISWVHHLSGGRVMVGVGAGFSEHEFAALGVPLEERHARLDEGLEIVKLALEGREFSYEGKFWSIPRARVAAADPPFFRAVSSSDSIRKAAQNGVAILLGTAAGQEQIDDYCDHGGDRANITLLRRVANDEEFHALRNNNVGRVIAWRGSNHG
jgi:alkanesulfonate monooxygenase SsuD/methylene tetrahydromethanopterin reductase-like flavin-dependent oxidoreductase (luciferase family)